MPENYTLYTEVDPNTHITPAASSVTLSGLDRGADTYLYRDFGADAWNGNFTVDFDFNVDAASASGSICEAFFLGNILDDVNGAHADRISARLYPYNNPSWNVGLFLSEKYGGTVYQDLNTSTGLALNTTYYARVKRVGTAFTFKVYASSANRSSETSPLVTLSLTLHATVAFRYFFPVNNYNSGHTLAFSGTLSNHNIVTGPASVWFASGTIAATSTVTGAAFPGNMVNAAGTIAGTSNIAGNANILKDAAGNITATSNITGTATGGLVIKTASGSINASSSITGNTSPIPARCSGVITAQSSINGAASIISGNIVARTVSDFTSGQTAEYRLKDGDGNLLRDWTSQGVQEISIRGDGTSTYRVWDIKRANVVIDWRITATDDFGTETINIHDSYIDDPISSRIDGTYYTAMRGLKLDKLDFLDRAISTLLAAADYIAPDNAGIAAIFEIATLLKKYARNKRTIWKDPATGIKYLIFYDDNGTTELVRKSLKGPAEENIADLATGSIATENASSV